MINPIKLTSEVEKLVCKNISRKYYRFRKTKFYGGCATADCLGCNLRCVYCWAQRKVWHPVKYGKFYTTKEVDHELTKLNQPVTRISGGEPTICKDHLLKVIELIAKKKLFVLETNGILLDDLYVKQLCKYENLYVRISLKGIDENTFEKITGIKGKYFKNQLRALKLLEKYQIEHRAAIIAELFNQGDINNLNIPNLEYESLIEYPFVMKALKERNII